MQNQPSEKPGSVIYKIPKNPELKKKWVQLLKRKGVRDSCLSLFNAILWRARKHTQTTFQQFSLQQAK